MRAGFRNPGCWRFMHLLQPTQLLFGGIEDAATGLLVYHFINTAWLSSKTATPVLPNGSE